MQATAEQQIAPPYMHISAMSDAFVAAVQCQVTLLALLDLSSASDCVDYSILLRRLRAAVWTDWFSSRLACIIRPGQDTASHLRRQTVAYGLCAFRGPTRLRTGTTPFRAVHRRAQRSCRRIRSDVASVCRRLSDLHRHARQSATRHPQ